MASLSENLIWDIRAFIYQHFAETTRAPSVDETAAQFDLTHEQVASAFEELHQRHAIFLKPGTHNILMANPFSGIPTEFKVHANNKTYFANCAWDSLGIPAALHVDAHIEATCSQSTEPIKLSIKDGQISNSDTLVHFLIPFKDWYNDLLFT
jgi:DNA-binding transcriptional MocR family regulator